MPKHVIEDDLLLTLDGYVKKNENTPNRIVVTDSKGDVAVKENLNATQLDHLKNVTSDIQLQINEKSDSVHTHEEYLTLEELKDVNFSGVAQDVVYNPENANLESTNVKDALDEVDNKIEEYIGKLVSDKAELKSDIADTNEEVTSLKRNVTNLADTVSNKADANHTHDGADHTHTDLQSSISTNTANINEIKSDLVDINNSIKSIPNDYASKNHTHADLQTQIDAINTDITDHRHQYLEDAITTVNEKANNNKSDITDIKGNVTDIKADIVKLNTGKSNIDHTHEASDHIHQDIVDDINNLNTTINEKINDEVDRADRAYSEKDHVHSEYATSDHIHPSSDHNHDGIYAPNFHLHNNLADKEHYHNDLYAELDHNHNGTFANAIHTHSDLANKEHTHSEFADFIINTDKDTANGVAGLDSHAKLSLSVLPDVAKAINIIGTKDEREALAVVEVGTIFRETDTGDSWIYDGNAWVILADADWANVNLQWNNIEGIPTEFNPASHNHTELADKEHTHEYAESVHGHFANEVVFEDGETLQQKLDEGSLGSSGGSTGGGDCNVVISNDAPTNLPVGGIWIDTSNL